MLYLGSLQTFPTLPLHLHPPTILPLPTFYYFKLENKIILLKTAKVGDSLRRLYVVTK